MIPSPAQLTRQQLLLPLLCEVIHLRIPFTVDANDASDDVHVDEVPRPLRLLRRLLQRLLPLPLLLLHLALAAKLEWLG